MRGNRKISTKMNVVAKQTVNMGIIMLTLFAMVIFNMLSSLNCKQLATTIGEKERVLAKLEQDCQRESYRWEQMKTADGLETALRDDGLSMHYPKAGQVVRMDSRGNPLPGQIAVFKAAQRKNDIRAQVSASSSAKRRR